MKSAKKEADAVRELAKAMDGMDGFLPARARSSTDRASRFEREGCKFEPCRARQ
jgi:hypothetical protein